MVVLFSTNIESCDDKTLKEIIYKVLNLDLSSDTTTRCEAYKTLTRLVGAIEAAQRHFFFGFVIAVPVEHTLQLMAMFDGLRITASVTEGNADLLIVSGTLDNWVRVVGHNSRSNVPASVLKILNGIQTILERYGLASVFYEYEKRPAKDGFYLEYQS